MVFTKQQPSRIINTLIMINDKELKFLHQVTDALIKAIGFEENEKGRKKAYKNIFSALTNRYIDTVKNED